MAEKRPVITIPEALAWARGLPHGAAWLAALPRLAAEAADRWELTLGDPLPGGVAALTLPATRADGSAAILKLCFPDEENIHEGSALRAWRGRGAARLLAEDAADRALLLERLDPGTQLWSVADEDAANEAAASVVRQLWIAADAPFHRLTDRARAWAGALPAEWERAGRPFERRLVDLVVGLVGELTADPVEQVLLHQDLHGGNILRDGNGWRAIDPQPLVGERAFDVASLLRDRRPALMADPEDAPRRIRRRLDQLAELLDLDRERARGWGIVHAIAWAVEEGRAAFNKPMVAAGRWLARA